MHHECIVVNGSGWFEFYFTDKGTTPTCSFIQNPCGF